MTRAFVIICALAQFYLAAYSVVAYFKEWPFEHLIWIAATYAFLDCGMKSLKRDGQ